MSRAISPPDWTRKRTLSASERDWVARRVWSRLAALVDPSAWVWLDETGSHLGYTLAYPGRRVGSGRTPRPRGTRARTGPCSPPVAPNMHDGRQREPL
jgi:hypothetical protein